MIFRHTLVHADLGTVQIGEPDGFKTITFKLSRNADFKSLWETFEGEFLFYDVALDRIREAIRLYGPDTTLNYNCDVSVNGFTWQKLIRAQLALDMIQEFENDTALLPIVKTDLTTKFKNRYDTPVDLMSEEDLDGNVADVFQPITLALPSQKIPKTTTYIGDILPADDVDYSITPTGEAIDVDGTSMERDYYHQANIKIEQDEISESFDTLLDWVLDPNDISPAIEMDDEAGEVVVTVGPTLWHPSFIGTLFADSSEADPSVLLSMSMTATFYLQKNAETPIVIGSTVGELITGPWATPPPGGPDTLVFNVFDMNYPGGSVAINVTSADTLKVYIHYGLFYNIDVGADTGVIKWSTRTLSIDDYSSEISFVIQSVFPDSEAEAFLVHDAGGQALDRITGAKQVFYSELLGSDRTNYRQYDSDGCYWRKAVIKGLQLRNYTLFEKPFFLSFKQWWEGINPILNLGLGYETVDGEEVIRVGGAEEFFDNTPLVRISNVLSITKSFDAEEMPKTVRIGYKQWQSDNISGIDDAQTKHTYASRLQKFGKEVVIESEFIGASLAIETTRRTTRKKSADYKFDDNTFIIALGLSGGSPDTTFVPELDEHFSSITNLRNPETRYNSIDTPARMFMRWAKSLFGGLQHYVGSFFKFTGGEGNYDMTSNYEVSDGCGEYDGELSEKQNIEVTDEFIHRGELVEITCKIELEDYLTINANRKNAVAISQTNYGHLPFFIKDLSFPIDGETTILAWPVQDFVIRQIESPLSTQVCLPGEDDVCEDAYLTENGDEYVTQDNECLVLN